MQSNLYEHKYLKYKAKYLALKQSGGAIEKFVILTKFDSIKSLLPQDKLTEKEFSVKQNCSEFEKKLNNVSHIYDKKNKIFVKISPARPLCETTKVQQKAEFAQKLAKEKLSPIVKEFGQKISASAEEFKKKVVPQLEQMGEKLLKTGEAAISKGISTAVTKGSALAEKGMASVSKKVNIIGNKMTGGSPYDIVLGIFTNTKIIAPSQSEIEKLISQEKYDVVIQYNKEFIGKSTFVVKKLD